MIYIIIAILVILLPFVIFGIIYLVKPELLAPIINPNGNRSQVVQPTSRIQKLTGFFRSGSEPVNSTVKSYNECAQACLDNNTCDTMIYDNTPDKIENCMQFSAVGKDISGGTFIYDRNNSKWSDLIAGDFPANDLGQATKEDTLTCKTKCENDSRCSHILTAPEGNTGRNGYTCWNKDSYTDHPEYHFGYKTI